MKNIISSIAFLLVMVLPSIAQIGINTDREPTNLNVGSDLVERLPAAAEVDCENNRRIITMIPVAGSVATQFGAIGSRYTPFASVDIFIISEATDSVILSLGGVTDVKGIFSQNFRMNFLVDPEVGGDFIFKAVERNTGCYTTANFSVNGPAAVQLSEHSHGPFDFATRPTVVFTGENFTPNEQVNITTLYNGRQTQVRTIETNREGDFRIPDLYTLENSYLFSNAGYRIITATDAHGNTAQDTMVTTDPELLLWGDGDFEQEDWSPLVGEESEIIISGVNYEPHTRNTINIIFPNRNGNNRGPATINVTSNGFGYFRANFTLNPALNWEEGRYTVTTGILSANQTAVFTYSNGHGPNPPDLVVKNIEITQGLQDLHQSVPLIRNKPTWVRVFVEAKNRPINDVICYLEATKNGRYLTTHSGNPQRPITNKLKAFCKDEPASAMNCGRSAEFRMDLDTGAFVRDDLSKSFNFRVPREWISEPGEITFTARTLIGSNTAQSDYDNDLMSKTVELYEPTKLGIARMRVHTHNPGDPPLNDISNFSITNYVKNLYPIGYGDLLEWSSSHKISPYLHMYHYGDEYDLTSKSGWQAAIMNLYWFQFNENPRIRSLGGGKLIWYGMVAPANKWAIDGKALGRCTPVFGGEPVAIGQYNGYNAVDHSPTKYWNHPKGGKIMAHEIGHLFGFHHIRGENPDGSSCGGGGCSFDQSRYPPGHIGFGNREGMYGFGTQGWNPVIIKPNEAADMMTYCDSKWISDKNYNRIFKKLTKCGRFEREQKFFCENNPNNLFDSYAAARATCSQKNKDDNYIVDVRNSWLCKGRRSNGLTTKQELNEKQEKYDMVMGQYNSDKQTIRLSAIMPITANNPSLNKRFANQKNVKETTESINLYNSKGIKTYTTPITYIEDSEKESQKYFLMILPTNEKIAKLEITSNAKAILSVKASANQPVVKLKSQAKETVINEEAYELSWTAYDKDSKDLSGMVQYSDDGGLTWNIIANVGPKESQVKIVMTDLAGTTNGLFRVILSDGINYTSATTNRFAVPDKKPEAVITNINEKSIYKAYKALLLRAFAKDLEDGHLDGQQVKWTSNISGSLGYGIEVETYLPEGIHTISLEVEDSKGHKTIAKKTIYIK